MKPSEFIHPEWAKQANQYETIRNDGAWNKTLQTYAIMSKDHPFSAVRVREVLKWGVSPQYQNIKNGLSVIAENTCPNCNQPIDPSWRFCRHCGFKLK